MYAHSVLQQAHTVTPVSSLSSRLESPQVLSPVGSNSRKSSHKQTTNAAYHRASRQYLAQVLPQAVKSLRTAHACTELAKQTPKHNIRHHENWYTRTHWGKQSCKQAVLKVMHGTNQTFTLAYQWRHEKAQEKTGSPIKHPCDAASCTENKQSTNTSKSHRSQVNKRTGIKKN